MSDQATQDAQTDQGSTTSEQQTTLTEEPKGVSPEGDTEATPSGEPKAEPEAPKDEPKGTEAEPPKPIELTLAENSRLDEAAMEEAKARYTELGLSPEQAQALWDREQQAVSGFQERQQQAFSQERDRWVEALKKDPEYGGDKYDQTVEDARLAFKHYGNDELVEALEATGFGDNDLLVKTFARIARDLKEDNPTFDGFKRDQEKTPEERWYPNQAKKK